MAIGPHWPDPAKKIIQFPHGRGPTLPSAKPLVQPTLFAGRFRRSRGGRRLVSVSQVQGQSSEILTKPPPHSILLRAPFTPDDFEAFIAERQLTLLNAIENLLIKERLDLSPNLRELDEQIEQAELRLRAFVASGLDGDVGLLPQHVLQKVDERMQRALKKNAALDADTTRPLPASLNIAIYGNCKTLLPARRPGRALKRSSPTRRRSSASSASSRSCATASATAAP